MVSAEPGTSMVSPEPDVRQDPQFHGEPQVRHLQNSGDQVSSLTRRCSSSVNGAEATPWCTCLRFHKISMSIFVSEGHESLEIPKKPECVGHDRCESSRFGRKSFNHGKRGRTRKMGDWSTSEATPMRRSNEGFYQS